MILPLHINTGYICLIQFVLTLIPFNIFTQDKVGDCEKYTIVVLEDHLERVIFEHFTITPGKDHLTDTMSTDADGTAAIELKYGVYEFHFVKRIFLKEFQFTLDLQKKTPNQIFVLMKGENDVRFSLPLPKSVFRKEVKMKRKKHKSNLRKYKKLKSDAEKGKIHLIAYPDFEIQF